MSPEKINFYVQILEIFIGSAGLGGLLKFSYDKYRNHMKSLKRKKDLGHTKDSFKNIERIYQDLINLSVEYRCNYVHILAFHNGGKAMNEISDKRITIKTEIRLDPKAPKLKHQWKNREIDFDWFPVINKVIDNRSFYIKDLTKSNQRENNGLRLLYNSGYGKEFLLSEIDWIGDSYVVLCIQREPQIRNLTFSERAFINHKAQDLVNLFSNAKYFLEGK